MMPGIINKFLTRIGLKKQSAPVKQPVRLEKPETKHETKPKRRHTNDTNIYYYYTQYDRLYFKTQSGRSPLRITAKESVRIVELYKRGEDIIEIFTKMDFYHEIGISTLKQWLKQYDKGLMDVALSWICDNHIDGIDVNKKRLIKNGGY